MFKKLSMLIVTLVILTGCASKTTITPYSKFDNTDKTITVPAGGGLNANIKVALKKNGWKLKVNSTSLVTQGTHNNIIDKETKLKSSTRYTLLTSYRKWRCVSCDCVLNYNISILDNNNGEEVVTFEGSGSEVSEFCYDDVSKELLNWMNKQ